MNIKTKALIVVIAISASIYGYSANREEPVKEYNGFLLNKYGYEFRDLNVRLLNRNTKPLFDTLNSDPTGVFVKYANGVDDLIGNTRTSEQIITKKPVIEYKAGQAGGFSIQPQGLAVGIQYGGRSNLNRTTYDEVAFGFLSKWFNSSDPKVISEKVFGDVVNKDIGFPLAILYFQRQILEQTALKDFSLFSKYQPIFADYSFLYKEYISQEKPFKKEALDNVNDKISKNISFISNFLYEQDKANNPDVNNMAMFLLEFYISEDIKLFKNLERDLKMITPLDNSFKQDLRLKRMESELRVRKLEAQEQEKARRKSPSMQY